MNIIVGAVGNLGPSTKRRRDEPLDLSLSVSGLTGRVDEPDEHLRWTEQELLKIGDKVEIEVLETIDVDPPQEMSPSGSEEERERQHFEYAKEVYFKFRPKFEPD